MSDTLFYIIIAVAGIGLFIVMIWYFLLSKKLSKEDLRYIKELRKGTEDKTFSIDVTFQKLYVFYTRIPFLNRYLAKLRRRLEIINVSSYTEYEKLDIAKKHLIPKELEEHGLTSLQVQITDKALMLIIRIFN